ncbi:MAG TPA: hypothetical protein ENI64_02125 [Gammaproteobacteria bacterium]|nr:hypothetical protein [Gammaproteobacteria bacterium]
MKKIIFTMFGVLASIPVSLVSTATVSANPYMGYMPPPWVRPAVPMPYMPYRAPYARTGYFPMVPYGARMPMMRPAMRPVPPMARPMPMRPMAQRHMPVPPPRQFSYNTRRAPLPAMNGRGYYPANQLARAPRINRAAPGFAPRPAPRMARPMQPPRQAYPGVAQFRPQYRFSQAPAPMRPWGRMPANYAQAPRYFQRPPMYNGPRRIARAPAPVWRAPVPQYRRPAVPPRQTAWRAAPARSVAPRRMNAWPAQYANQNVPPRQGYQSARYRPYPSAMAQPQRPAYGTHRVSYAYNGR